VAVEASAATGEELRDRLLAAPLIEGAVLFPVDDPAALFVADHADELGRRFRLPAQPPGLARSLADKRRLARLAAAAGVPTPGSVAVGSPEEAAAFLADHGLPVVVKAGDPISLHRQEGATSVTVAQTEEEFHQAVAHLLEGPEPNVLLQEHIPGDPSTVWMVNAYLDRQGQCGFAGVGRKLRQYPVGRGATTLGVTEDNDEALGTALSLLSFAGYRGIVDMGLRFDERDGQYKVLDVNPRVGATFRLFSAADGTDVVRAMYLDLTGCPVPSPVAATGRHWWNEPWDLAGALGEWRAGRLDASAYLASLRAVDETALYARDDPAPLLGGWRAGSRRIAAAAPGL
jgi:predicted ATP-grasp superfamily ATP-dependent carboligase